LIVLRGVSKQYSTGMLALDKVDLEIKKGEFVFVVGQSGAGKSTLIKLLYREETPSGGQVILAGKDLTKIKRREVPFLRRKIGVVFQDFKLLTDRTVAENVAFALMVTGYTGRDPVKSVTQVLSLVGLKERQNAYPSQLSGGEQQRVAIARALVRNPDLLLADEPSGNLDPDTSWEIVKLLSEINARGTTVIMATHARNIVNSLRRRVVAMEQGRVVRDQEHGVYDDED
jgi:cell division transport system ATP-binding protein